MKEIHILVTGVGRRIELLQAFRQAALRLNINLKIYGADVSGTAPALEYCDYTRKVCSMRDSRYIQELVDICKKDKINLAMPTIDTDLLMLSRSVEVFESIGTKVLISKLDKILICRDKNNTGKFFESCGLKAPKTYNNYKEYFGPYPCFIKPKDGSSSINAFKVEDEEELSVYAGQIEDYIIQPFISGREFTIDIFCDFDGNPIYITPRERIQVRAGEVLKTQIYMDDTMINEAKVLCKAFKPCGPMTVQLIQDKNTGENYYIEINPRYGGGAPLSMKSGARSAEALLRLLCGERVEYQRNSSCNGAIYSRFDQSVCYLRAQTGLHPHQQRLVCAKALWPTQARSIPAFPLVHVLQLDHQQPTQPALDRLPHHAAHLRLRMPRAHPQTAHDSPRHRNGAQRHVLLVYGLHQHPVPLHLRTG